MRGRVVNDRRRGLLASWDLSEASGSRADKIGAANLTDTGGVTGAAGPEGACCAFGGAANLSAPVAGRLQISGTPLTLLVWVYLTSKAASAVLASQWDATGSQRALQLDYFLTSDRYSFFLSGDGVASTECDANTFGSPPLSTWHFLAAQFDPVAGMMGLSVNGGAFDRVAFAGPVKVSTAAFVLGSSLSSGAGFAFLSGRMSRCALFNRVLTLAEVNDWYGKGFGRLP